MVDGLEYIHNQGVIHRDIKPGNLLLTTDGVLKISDFGVAEVLDKYKPSDLLQKTLGSPAYQSPQIASGSDAFSGIKLDIWAAGVTLFQMVTGDMPFKGENLFLLYENIAKGDFPIPEYVQGPLRNLILGLLDKNEDSRFSIAQIKDNDWFKGEADADQAILAFFSSDPSSNHHHSASFATFHLNGHLSTNSAASGVSTPKDFFNHQQQLFNDRRKSPERKRSNASMIDPEILKGSPAYHRTQSSSSMHSGGGGSVAGSRNSSWSNFSLMPYIIKAVGEQDNDSVAASESETNIQEPTSTSSSSFSASNNNNNNSFNQFSSAQDNQQQQQQQQQQSLSPRNVSFNPKLRRKASKNSKSNREKCTVQ